MANREMTAVLGYIQRIGSDIDSGAETDRQLLARFAERRDERAFAALVARHGSLVYGACRRLLPHTQDAEDAFQAAFLVLARKAAVIAWQESVASWLHEVACRVAAEARGRVARRRMRETLMETPPEIPVAPAEPDLESPATAGGWSRRGRIAPFISGTSLPKSEPGWRWQCVPDRRRMRVQPVTRIHARGEKKPCRGSFLSSVCSPASPAPRRR